MVYASYFFSYIIGKSYFFEKNKKLHTNWECPKYGSLYNRDINASENIMFEGLKISLNSL